MPPQAIYAVMVDVGFPPVVATTVTAIAMRESGGVPTAFNGDSATGDRSYGLLQINLRDPNVAELIKRALPQVAADEKALFDPHTNARAGFLLWGGDNRNLDIAWYISRPGLYQQRYRAHLGDAQDAALAHHQSVKP